MSVLLKIHPNCGSKFSKQLHGLLHCHCHRIWSHSQKHLQITACTLTMESHTRTSSTSVNKTSSSIPDFRKLRKCTYHTHLKQHKIVNQQTSSNIRLHTQTVTEDNKVTFENIFSDANRQKVVQHLGTVKPVRTKELMGIKKEIKVAAVLVPLCMVDGEPSVLLTVRSSSLRLHRGEVCFPGGNKDDSDPDLTHTALREAFEEIGLNPRHFDVWGNLTPSPSSRKVIVYPVLARYTKNLDVKSLKLNTEEVEEVFTCSIRDLCGSSKIKVGSTQFRSGPGYTLPVYVGTQQRIWGMTAIILHQVLMLMAPSLYTYKVRHVS